jgi:hypothetical protein
LFHNDINLKVRVEQHILQLAFYTSFIAILPRQLQFWNPEDAVSLLQQAIIILQWVTLRYHARTHTFAASQDEVFQHITLLFQRKHAHDTYHSEQSVAGSQLTFIMTPYSTESGGCYNTICYRIAPIFDVLHGAIRGKEQLSITNQAQDIATLPGLGRGETFFFLNILMDRSVEWYLNQQLRNSWIPGL